MDYLTHRPLAGVPDAMLVEPVRIAQLACRTAKAGQQVIVVDKNVVL